MPAKIPVDDNVKFLFSCLIRSDFSRVTPQTFRNLFVNRDCQWREYEKGSGGLWQLAKTTRVGHSRPQNALSRIPCSMRIPVSLILHTKTPLPPRADSLDFWLSGIAGRCVVWVGSGGLPQSRRNGSYLQSPGNKWRLTKPIAGVLGNTSISRIRAHGTRGVFHSLRFRGNARNEGGLRRSRLVA